MVKSRKIKFPSGAALINFFASLKITVVGLLLLFILTFWGTVAQVDHGLYASQERYFASFYFLAKGWLPFPGAQLVLWILFINLVCALFNAKLYKKTQLGILIIHYGLILFFVAAFVTFHNSKESHLTLREGESANVSASFRDWEIAVWLSPLTRDEIPLTKLSAGPSPQQKLPGTEIRNVTAIDVDHIDEGRVVPLDGLTLQIKAFYPNSLAYSAPLSAMSEKYLNASGITVLKPTAADKEPEKNVAGVILQLADADHKKLILLYGLETKPIKVSSNGKDFFLILRHRHFPLPLNVRLLDFMMEKHPGTEVARSFKSKVEVEHEGISREVMISMNEPLRFKEYTFYQASYQIDAMGRESSTLAVVKNSGRVLPYIATFVTFFGLAWHFFMAGFSSLTARKIK